MHRLNLPELLAILALMFTGNTRKIPEAISQCAEKALRTVPPHSWQLGGGRSRSETLHIPVFSTRSIGCG